jgi:hypothetical protein
MGMCTSSSAGAAKAKTRRATTNRYFINYYISYLCQVGELIFEENRKILHPKDIFNNTFFVLPWTMRIIGGYS